MFFGLFTACTKTETAIPAADSESPLIWSKPNASEQINLNDSLELVLEISPLWGLHEYTLEIQNSQKQEVYYEGEHSHQWNFELKRKLSFKPFGAGSYMLYFKAINHNSEFIEKNCVIQVIP